MRAIICERPELLSIQSKEQPQPNPDESLLQVKRVGICGTDLHAFKGNQPFFSYPRILGHELATQVIESGNNASRIKAGDKAVLIPYINCEKCDACLAGKSNCCENLKVFGVHTDGGMQDIISFPTRLLIPANDLSYDEIAIVEPLAIGAHALRRANVKKNDLIVVMGCGPIGMGIIQLGKYIGATVVAIDINESRLNLTSKSFQADLTLNALQTPMERIKQTYGSLAHTVFDATGSKVAIEGGINYMRHGGNFVLVGLFKGELAFHHPAIHAKETTLMCSRNATREDFDFVLNVLREKKFNTDAYITRKTNSENIVTGFHEWSSPSSQEIKVISDWESD
jgi:2-desacetyl-2-hydroxyethyl bacteriochlorophyllide A dehydrogenase